MKKEIILLILVIGCLSIFGILEFFQKENLSGLKSKLELTLNHPPQVETRGVGTGCGIPVAEIFFYFSDPDLGNYLTAYQLQVDDNSDFSHCPGENCLFDTGKETKIEETLKSYGSTFKFSLPKELPKKVYFWRVKVWDNQDVSSDWAEATLDLNR